MAGSPDHARFQGCFRVCSGLTQGLFRTKSRAAHGRGAIWSVRESLSALKSDKPWLRLANGRTMRLSLPSQSSLASVEQERLSKIRLRPGTVAKAPSVRIPAPIRSLRAKHTWAANPRWMKDGDTGGKDRRFPGHMELRRADGGECALFGRIARSAGSD